MTDEQREARKLSAESGNIRWIKDHCLRTKDGNDDYVFISYKSDDFERVLDDIVYKTCKKYGLRVYFDTAFDEDSDSWITQYYDNMCDPHCRAFIAFIDDAYYSSYACLLEMMSRKTAAAGGDYKVDSLFFLPINIGSITDIVDNSNTGLGTKRYSNGKINNHADEELERFNEIFSEVADDFMRKSIYKRENDTLLYEEATAESPKYGKIYLTVTQCRRLMERVIPKKIDNDGGNKAFVDVIHDKLINAQIDTVFEKIKEGNKKHNVAVINNDVKSVLTVEDGSLISEPDQGIKNGFEFKGWFYNDLKWNFEDDIVDKDVELIAKWVKIEKTPTLSEETLLEELEKLCENIDFCRKLREARSHIKGGKQFCDYFMASLLGGCDKKIEKQGARFNYCACVVSKEVDWDDLKLGASQFTWQSNSRKAMRKEAMPQYFFDDKGRVKAGKLGESSTIFESLSTDLTIGDVLEKYKKQEKGFYTRDNEMIFKEWEEIKKIDCSSIKYGNILLKG